MATRRAVIACTLLACTAGVSCAVRERSHSGYQYSQPTVDYYAIDTNGVLPAANIAAPGDGAAILISYMSGGRWRVETQCDVNRSQQACNYQIEARAVGGTVANVVAEAVTPGQDTAGSYPPDLAILYSTSTTEIDAISFDTYAGGSVQFSNYLDGYSAPPELIVWMSGGIAMSPTYAGDFVLTPTAP